MGRPAGTGKQGSAASADLGARIASSANSVIAGYLQEWYERAASRHDRLQFVYRRVLGPGPDQAGLSLTIPA